jgi:hypothetical protein
LRRRTGPEIVEDVVPEAETAPEAEAA